MDGAFGFQADETSCRSQLAATLVAQPRLAERLPSAQSSLSPIHYVVLGDADDAIVACQRLLAKGFLVNPVALPAVPLKKAGVRFTLVRSHTNADVQALVAALVEVVSEPRPRQVSHETGLVSAT